MSETEAFPLYDVTISRGKSVVKTSVPKHEIDVLRAVHGPDRVQEAGKTDDEIVLNTSADAEWNRLQRRYKRINATDPVGIAYRTGPRGLEPFGFDLGRGSTEAAPQSGVRNHKKPAKADAKKAKADKAE